MRAAGRGTIVLTGSVAADRASASAVSRRRRQGRRCGAWPARLHKELAADGVHATTVTIDGVLSGPKALDLDDIADLYWQLHSQPEPPADVTTFPVG